MRIAVNLLKTIKIRFIFLFIVFLGMQIVIPPSVLAQKKNYSVERKLKSRKPKKHFSFRNWFRTSEQRAIKKEQKKQERKERKALKEYRKSVKRYQKRANKGKQQGKSYSVYKRMKRDYKKTKRARRGKRSTTWFQRLFLSSKKAKKRKINTD